MVTEYGYLVAASNEMHRAYLARHTAAANLARAANLGCDTFRELAQDQAFFSDISMLAEMRKRNAAEVEAIVRVNTLAVPNLEVLDAFTNFLNAEKRVLIASGMDTDLVEMLIGQANQLIDQVRAEQIDPELMRAKVGQLRRIACKVADSLRRQQKHELIWGDIWKLTIAAGGCAIVGLNATSVVATIGLSTAGAAVSGAIGSALVGVGTTIVVKDWFDGS